jgi:hypothetical protein
VRKVAAALAFIGLVVSANSAAAAAPKSGDPAGSLIIRGQTSGIATLLLGEQARISIEQIDVAAKAGAAAKSFVGLAISRKGHVAFGFYRDSTTDGPLVFGRANAVLPRGRYQVYLMTTAPTTLRLTLAGTRSVYTVRTRRGIAPYRRVVSAQNLSITPVASASAPLDIMPTTMSLIVFSAESEAENASRYSICLSTRPTPCLAGETARFEGTDVNVVNTGKSARVGAMFVYPGEVPSASYYADAERLSAGALTASQLTVVAFDV